MSTSPSQPPMIDVHELTKLFTSGRSEALAVDRLSLSVAGGEVYGLLGANGAGKTTTLRMILGLLEPTSGYAEVGGFRTSENPDEVKRRIGLVSASAGLYPWLTPREILLFFADLYGVAPSTARERLVTLSDVMGLREFLHRRCAVLSTGQAQRVNLARALMHDPPIMLLDEPTRGLDVVGSQVVFDFISHLSAQGKAVIVCTHRLDQAQRICSRFGLLHQGRLVEEGSLSQLRASTGKESLVDIVMGYVTGAVGA